MKTTLHIQPNEMWIGARWTARSKTLTIQTLPCVAVVIAFPLPGVGPVAASIDLPAGTQIYTRTGQRTEIIVPWTPNLGGAEPDIGDLVVVSDVARGWTEHFFRVIEHPVAGQVGMLEVWEEDLAHG